MRLLLPNGIGDRHCCPRPNSALLSSVNETEEGGGKELTKPAV